MVRLRPAKAVLCALLACLAAAKSHAVDFDGNVQIAELSAKIKASNNAHPAKPKSAGVCDGRFTTPRPPFPPADNAHGVLWKISDPAGATSYLFGTEHANDPRVTDLLAKALPYFAAAREVYTEVDMDHAQQDVYSQRTVLENGRTLADIVRADLLAKALDLMKSYRVEYSNALQMKPWAVFSVLGRPRNDSALQLDQMIFNQAQREGKPLTGLQSAAEITGMLDSIALRDQIEMLKDAVCDYDDNQKDSEILTKMYAREDIGPMFDYTVRLEAPAHVATFMKTMVYDRSKLMALRLDAPLRRGAVFVAVGATHLPGDKGILSLLQGRGFTVTPVNLNDRADLPQPATSTRPAPLNYGPDSPLLDGDIPRLVRGEAIAALWQQLKSLLGAPAGLAAPRIHFDVFSAYEQDIAWTLWQEQWQLQHPEFHHLRQAGQLGWFYTDTNRIQLSPGAFTVSYSVDPQTGMQRDFGGFGYLEAAHEMAHYIYSAQNIPVERHHGLLYCGAAAGADSVMDQTADFLGTQGVASADFLRAAIRRVKPIYCSAAEETLGVKDVRRLLNGH